ncbi:protein kinase family protein [Fulvitalea axinellae]|uniref:hypothetical protein n=1 Tax=Fulvitalea axinellae TaxID=1182444 RepID=UPI0030CA43CB
MFEAVQTRKGVSANAVPLQRSQGVTKLPPALFQGIPLQALFTSEAYLSMQESNKRPYKSGIQDISKLLRKYHDITADSGSLSKTDRFKYRLVLLFEMETGINNWSKENDIPFTARFSYPNLHMQQAALREIQVERMELMKDLRADRDLIPAFFPLFNPTSFWSRREDERLFEKDLMPVWYHLISGGIRCADDVDTSSEVLETELMANLSVLMLTGTGKSLLTKVYEAQHARADLKNKKYMHRLRKNLFLMNQKIPESRQLHPERYVSGSKQYADYSFEMPFAWETGRYMAPKSRFMRSARPVNEANLTFHPSYLQLAIVLEDYLKMMGENEQFRGEWQARQGKDYYKWIAEECNLPEFSKMDPLPLVDTMNSRREKKSEWILIDEEDPSSESSELELTLPGPWMSAGQHPETSLLSGFRSTEVNVDLAGPSSSTEQLLQIPEDEILDTSDTSKSGILRSFDSPLFEWNVGDSPDEDAFSGTLVTDPVEKFVGKVHTRCPSQGNRSVVFFLSDDNGNRLVVKFLKEGSFSEDAAKEAFGANFLKAFGTPHLQSQSCVMLAPSAPSWQRLMPKLDDSPDSKKFVAEHRTSLAKSLPFILVMERAVGKPLDVRHVDYGSFPSFMISSGELAFFELLLGNHDRVLSGIYMMNLQYDTHTNLMNVIDHILSPGGMSACLSFAVGHDSDLTQQNTLSQRDPMYGQKLMQKYRTTFERLYGEFLQRNYTPLSTWVMNKSNARNDRVHFTDRWNFDIGFVRAALHFLRMEKHLTTLLSNDFLGKDPVVSMFLEACAVVNDVTRQHKDMLEEEVRQRKAQQQV